MIAVFVFIVTSLLIQTNESKDFCQSFSTNDFKVSLFERLIFENNIAVAYVPVLIVGQYYWPVKTRDLWEISSIGLLTSEIWINGSDYRFGFNIFSRDPMNDSEYGSFFGLWQKNNKIIDVFNYETNDTFFGSIKLYFDGFNPEFSIFGLFWKGPKPYQLCFGEQTLLSSNHSIYRRKYRCFLFGFNGIDFTIEEKNKYVEQHLSNSANDLKIKKNFRGNDSFFNYTHPHKLIGQFIQKYYLYQLEKTIYYCEGYGYTLFSFECKTELKLLIDCNHIKGEEEKPYLWLWIIIGLIVFLFVIILILVLWFTYKSKQKIKRPNFIGPTSVSSGTDIREYDTSSTSDSTLTVGQRPTSQRSVEISKTKSEKKFTKT